MSDMYILDGHKAVLCDDLIEWNIWFSNADRHVGNDKQNNIQVSTIFLGFDHSFGRCGKEKGLPLLFETRVFGGEHDQDREKYSTWEEAERGHKKMCDIVFVK